ncbi:response regulator transcription factor [Aeoliella sp.]|uniref:response regulator transcription factor n=1 Tax=Aeoliella sp. TaxID=2795800 RepID=UPI003CCB826A
MTSARRVLIVDDEPDIREGVGRWLNACGYETSVAFDGDAGVAAAHATNPDAILLDVMMPRKDGLQALEELRASPDTSGIPIVMLSASLRDEQRALDAGATFFVHKPYDGKKLVAAVQSAIESS